MSMEGGLDPETSGLLWFSQPYVYNTSVPGLVAPDPVPAPQDSEPAPPPQLAELPAPRPDPSATA